MFEGKGWNGAHVFNLFAAHSIISCPGKRVPRASLSRVVPKPVTVYVVQEELAFCFEQRVFQVSDCRSRRLCHVCGHLAGFYRLRNVFAASLRRQDCQEPLQHRLGHLVGWVTLHNASAMFPVEDDCQGSDFWVRRHLVVVLTLHNVAQSVFFAILLCKGGGGTAICICVSALTQTPTHVRRAVPQTMPDEHPLTPSSP